MTDSAELTTRAMEELIREQYRIAGALEDILGDAARAGEPAQALADEQWDPEPEREKIRRRPAGRRKPEREVVAEAIAFLRQRGYARKVHGGVHGNAGEPDVDAVVQGRGCKFEAKASGAKPTPVQMAAMQRWAKAGALVGWFRNNEHLTQLLEHLDDTTFVPDLTQPGCTCPLHQIREA